MLVVAPGARRKKVVPLTPVTASLNVAVTLVPTATEVPVGDTVAVGRVVSAGGGAVPPVPESGTLTILPFESVTRRLAVLLPVVVGLNCTPISQPLSGATVTPVQPAFGPSLKCDAPVPVIATVETVSGPLPLLPITALSSTDVEAT